MDRDGAHFRNTVASMKTRLVGWGEMIVIQLPLFNNLSGNHGTRDGCGGKIDGVVDLVTMEALTFAAPTGSVVTRTAILPNSEIYSEILDERSKMIESLGELDEDILQRFVDADLDASKISVADLKQCLRAKTISGAVVPILCGASFRNMGVQPVLVKD